MCDLSPPKQLVVAELTQIYFDALLCLLGFFVIDELADFLILYMLIHFYLVIYFCDFISLIQYLFFIKSIS